MLRRIKRFLGFSVRGSYFPNNDTVSPADGSIVSSGSRRSTKTDKKSKKEKKKSPLTIEHEQQFNETQYVTAMESPLEESTTSQQQPDVVAVLSTITTTTEVVIGGEDTVDDHNTVKTDSLPYREPSDKSQNLTSASTTAPPSVSADGASTRSIVGSENASQKLDMAEEMPVKNPSFDDSIYSNDTDEMLPPPPPLPPRLNREVAVDCPIGIPPTTNMVQNHSEASSLFVNIPDTPKEEIAVTKEEEKKSLQVEIDGNQEDKDLMQKWKEMNESIDGILKKPPPFQVSTARLPPMRGDLSAAPTDDSLEFSAEDFEDRNNSVTRILNESHEVLMKSPENKHLRSCGY